MSGHSHPSSPPSIKSSPWWFTVRNPAALRQCVKGPWNSQILLETCGYPAAYECGSTIISSLITAQWSATAFFCSLVWHRKLPGAKLLTFWRAYSRSEHLIHWSQIGLTQSRHSHQIQRNQTFLQKQKQVCAYFMQFIMWPCHMVGF